MTSSLDYRDLLWDHKRDQPTSKQMHQMMRSDGSYDVDWRRLAQEVSYHNNRFRGIGGEDLKDLIITIQKYGFGLDKNREAKFEDLFHQAMAQLEMALAGEDEIEPDAALLLDQWQKMLTNA